MDSGNELLKNEKHENIEKCDFESKTEQNRLQLQENIFYIVAVVIVNQLNQVLMMQEAKSSCYGMWYLPAGKMEPGETIVEAAKREVAEETGLEFSPTDILCVEECGGRWVRFTLTGTIVGGTMKTESMGDEESLQATWWDTSTELPLRARDVLHLIDRGLEYHKSLKRKQPELILPTLQPQSLFALRVMAVRKHNTCVQMLKYGSKFPTTQVSQEDISIRTALLELFLKAGLENVQYEVIGLTGMEHDGRESQNGICFNVLVLINEEQLAHTQNGFEWIQPDSQISNIVTKFIDKEIRTIPILSLKLMKK